MNANWFINESQIFEQPKEYLLNNLFGPRIKKIEPWDLSKAI